MLWTRAHTAQNGNKGLLSSAGLGQRIATRFHDLALSRRKAAHSHSVVVATRSELSWNKKDHEYHRPAFTLPTQLPPRTSTRRGRLGCVACPTNHQLDLSSNYGRVTSKDDARLCNLGMRRSDTMRSSIKDYHPLKSQLVA